MAAIRAPKVVHAASFDQDVETLREKFSEIRLVVENLEDALIFAWGVPHIPIDPDKFPGIYGVGLDYPPAGSNGLGLFFATYHASEIAANPMRDPLRTYTLLTIAER